MVLLFRSALSLIVSAALKQSQIGGAEAESGEFDREEGKIRGEGNKARDAGTVAKTTGAGAAVGGIAGTAAGHAGIGAGVGAATGAAAELAAVLLSRGPDLVWPKGSAFEMVLDRKLRFKESELGFYSVRTTRCGYRRC